MYTIAGATGQVGGATADLLLAAGHRVRALTRHADRAAHLHARGGEVVEVDLADRPGLTRALEGSDAAFILLPFDPAAPDPAAQVAELRASIVGAVADAAVPQVTLLSSLGADLPEGTGPIVDLHHLEEQLRAAVPSVTAIRSPHFQEKALELLDAARGEGVFPVFGPADVPLPMVATRDIGQVAATTLAEPTSGHQVVDLDAPAVTERHVAAVLGEILGRDLTVVELEEAAWTDAFIDAGLAPAVAASMAELYRATTRGLLIPRGDRLVRCETTVEQTLAARVPAAVS